MEQENYENSSDRKIESVFSSRVRAGKRRTYFFDVRATRANDYFLTITESRKRFDNNGYDRHKVFIYKEDFNKFIKAITEAIDFVKTELMPDFDFDAFNHEGEEEGAYAPDARVTPSAFDARVTPSAFDASVTPSAPDASVTPSAFDSSVTPSAPDASVTPSAPDDRGTPAIPTENIAAAPIPAQEDHDNDEPIYITEKKPLEARDSKASEGDNLSGEEVDKW